MGSRGGLANSQDSRDFFDKIFSGVDDRKCCHLSEYFV